jgi:hypothetical protein
MMFKQKLSLGFLAVVVFLTRWGFRSHYLYDLDSVNFGLAIRRFDPRVHQPHPPGYFLYVALGRLLNTVFHDANLAFVVLSIIASCGAVIVIYKLSMDWFSPLAAQFAATIFLLSPLAWFHGTVALTYIVEAFFSMLLGYLCWRVYCGNERLALWSGVVLGISAGIRPSSLLFLTPIFLFSLRKTTQKERWMGLAALATTLAAWFFPMILACGGFKAYFGALISLWRMVPSKDTVFNSSPATSIARACTIIFISFLCFGAASLAPLVAMVRSGPVDTRKKKFTIVWMTPALCFFTFGYLKFVNSGYLLLIAAPACMWLGLWASEWYEASVWRRSMKLALIGVCAAANILIFLASPFYCSYRQMRLFEIDLESIRKELPQVASPRDTVIISFDSHFEGFRHAGYYLPEYLTIEYPAAKLREGPRIFVMHERDTQLLTELPIAPYTRFVLFPLPKGISYREFLIKTLGRLPAENLRTVSVGRHEFITGSISDLPLLFPSAESTPEQGVYVPLHSGMLHVNSRSHCAELGSRIQAFLRLDGELHPL